MKNTFLILSVIFTPLASFAGFTVNCDGNSDHSLSLYINNSNVSQVKIQTQGSLPKVFGAQLVSIRGDSVVYKLSGLSGLMEVEKEVLGGAGGWLRLESQNFNCDSN